MSDCDLDRDKERLGSETRDISDVFDDIALSEDNIHEESYRRGFEDGKLAGNTDGYHLGYHRGAELGAELGYYYGVLQAAVSRGNHSDRIRNAIDACIQSIDSFPRTNDENVDILKQADVVRAQYRKTCALLKINGKYPEADQLAF